MSELVLLTQNEAPGGFLPGPLDTFAECYSAV